VDDRFFSLSLAAYFSNSQPTTISFFLKKINSQSLYLPETQFSFLSDIFVFPALLREQMGLNSLVSF
jgi:hypothetical protein